MGFSTCPSNPVPRPVVGRKLSAYFCIGFSPAPCVTEHDLEVPRQIKHLRQSFPARLEAEPAQDSFHPALPEEVVHEVVDLEELVSQLRVLHAPHGADLRGEF